MTSQREPTESPEARHQPKQPRSHETRKSILDAAAEVFADRGYENTTTHQIAREAGVSVGALYRYFSDKQSILKELYVREVSAQRQQILDEFNLIDIVGKDLRQLVLKALALAFRVYSERPGLRRVLAEQSRKNPELAELRRVQESEVYEAVRQILVSVPGVRLPDVEVGAYLVGLFMESLIDDYLLYRRGLTGFDEARTIEGATDFILQYLLGKVDSFSETLTR